MSANAPAAAEPPPPIASLPPQAPPAHDPGDALESGARTLLELVIRIATLPFAMAMAKPKLIVAESSGPHRALPKPFLLALVTGVVLWGVFAHLDKLGFDANSNRKFASAVAESYERAAKVEQALLFAMPYIAGIWLFAGVCSLLMGRGFKNISPLFAVMSFACSSIVVGGVYVGLIVLVVAAIYGVPAADIAAVPAFGATLIFSLVVAGKLIRSLLLMRVKAWWAWAGAFLTSAVAFLMTLLFGAFLGVVAIAVGEEVGRDDYDSESAAAAGPDAVAPAAAPSAAADAPRDSQTPPVVVPAPPLDPQSSGKPATSDAPPKAGQ